MRITMLHGSLLIALAFAATVARAVPIVPRGDDEVVEVLSAAAGDRAEERRLRRQLAEHPGDATLASAAARRYLERARAEGDPRQAGRALAALRHWPDPADAPDEVLLLQATLDQYLHDFDAAAAKLERLVARRPRQPQAWLTLATVRRVQGRYADSDAACRHVAESGAGLHAAACLAENDGLRGRSDAARTKLRQLLATARLDAASRAWLLTTLAELEERAGDDEAANAAWRAALQAGPDPYAMIGFADHLIRQRRYAEALALMNDQPRTDAVVLRRAIAGTLGGAPSGPADAREMRERIVLANERPGVATFHGREQAMFALWVERRADQALALARENARQQREPLDLLVFAQAAASSGDASAMQEVRHLRHELGLVDRRVEALW